MGAQCCRHEILEQELFDLRNRIQQMRTDKLRLIAKIESFEHEIKSAAAQKDELRLKLRDSQKEGHFWMQKWKAEKESHRHEINAMAVERDELKRQLQDLQLQLSSKDNEYSAQMSNLQATIEDLQEKLRSAKNTPQPAARRTAANLFQPQVSVKKNEHSAQISSLEVMEDLQEKLKQAHTTAKFQHLSATELAKEKEQLQNKIRNLELSASSSLEIEKRDSQIKELETKVVELQDIIVQSGALKQELDNAKAEMPVLKQRILDLEQQTEALHNQLNETRDAVKRAELLVRTLRGQLQSSKNETNLERIKNGKIAQEKESISTDLANAEKTIEELLKKIADDNQRQVTPQPSSFASASAPCDESLKKMYTCPRCKRFQSKNKNDMKQHLKDDYECWLLLRNLK